MKLVQEHIIKSNHQDYVSLMDLCHLFMRKYTKVSPDELLFQGVDGLVFNPRVIQL